jgi:hypothetical protein
MADEITPGDEPPAEQPKYDQAFFLALAAKGKDAWNAWRRDPANKDVRVTFAGIDFSEAPRFCSPRPPPPLDFRHQSLASLAHFTKNCQRLRITISNATSISRNARPNGAGQGA